MKTSGNKKALTHERIVQTASRALRLHGFGGVGVAEVMKSAGLTHGGFYAHFDSRDTLLAEATEAASQDSIERMVAGVSKLSGQGMSPFRAFVEFYLSNAHACNPEEGCPIPALCAEMPRQEGAVLDASRQIIKTMHKLVMQALPDAAPTTAWAVISTIVGAVQLARTLGDSKEAKAILAETRSELLMRYDV